MTSWILLYFEIHMIFLSSIRLLPGYPDNKSGTHTFFGFDSDLPMVFIDDFLGDHQSNAGALGSLG